MGREALLEILGLDVDASSGETCHAVRIQTDRGAIAGRYYEAEPPGRAVIMVGGIGGGFDSPARDLYPRLAEDLRALGISTLRIKYRTATDLSGAVLDTLAGIVFLKSRGMQAFGVVGHSFGGAVAVQAAANEPAVRCVAVLSTQGYGTDPLTDLDAATAVLFIHGGRDEVLPSSSSINAYALAHEPKRIVIHPGAGHALDEAADEVYREVRAWIIAHLTARPPVAASR